MLLNHERNGYLPYYYIIMRRKGFVAEKVVVSPRSGPPRGGSSAIGVRIDVASDVLHPRKPSHFLSFFSVPKNRFAHLLIVIPVFCCSEKVSKSEVYVKSKYTTLHRSD